MSHEITESDISRAVDGERYERERQAAEIMRDISREEDARKEAITELESQVSTLREELETLREEVNDMRSAPRHPPRDD